MRRDKIKALLMALAAPSTGSRGPWVLGPCPLAKWRHSDGVDSHPSFGVKESATKSFCKCFSCGFGGSLDYLVAEFIKHSDRPKSADIALASSLVLSELDEAPFEPGLIPEYESIEQQQDLVFPECLLEQTLPAKDNPSAMSYLASRHVDLQLIAFHNVRYWNGYVCFPYRNFSGQLVGVQCRAIDNTQKLRYYQWKYQGNFNNTVWMGEDKVDLDKPVVLVEGPFDLLSVQRVYTNVLASFTSGLSKAKMQRISDASEIITFYDYGSGGDSARKKIDEFFTGALVRHIVPSETDDDVGNMDEFSISKALGLGV